jgi:hypothetical protein
VELVVVRQRSHELYQRRERIARQRRERQVRLGVRTIPVRGAPGRDGDRVGGPEPPGVRLDADVDAVGRHPTVVAERVGELLELERNGVDAFDL